MNDRSRMMCKALNMYQRKGWKWTNGMYGNQWKTQWVRGKDISTLCDNFVEVTKMVEQQLIEKFEQLTTKCSQLSNLVTFTRSCEVNARWGK